MQSAVMAFELCFAKSAVLAEYRGRRLRPVGTGGIEPPTPTVSR